MADSLQTPHIVPVLEGSRPKLLEEVRHTVRMPALQPADRVLGHSDVSVTGTVDLMLTFIEAGTEQAADLGYGWTRIIFRHLRTKSTRSPNLGLHFRRRPELRRRLGSLGCGSVPKTLVGAMAITSMTSSHA